MATATKRAFIQASRMTAAELEEHLLDAHGFRDYERPGESGYFAGVERDYLGLLHTEDHAEYPLGGSQFCPHTHDKEN